MNQCKFRSKLLSTFIVRQSCRKRSLTSLFYQTSAIVHGKSTKLDANIKCLTPSVFPSLFLASTSCIFVCIMVPSFLMRPKRLAMHVLCVRHAVQRKSMSLSDGVATGTRTAERSNDEKLWWALFGQPSPAIARAPSEVCLAEPASCKCGAELHQFCYGKSMGSTRLLPVKTSRKTGSQTKGRGRRIPRLVRFRTSLQTRRTSPAKINMRQGPGRHHHEKCRRQRPDQVVCVFTCGCVRVLCLWSDFKSCV